MRRPTTPPQPDMRQRILDTAGRLFAERGYAATSVRDIAGELGIANPSLYHHFSSKADLLGELLRGPLDRVDRALAEAQELTGTARTQRIVEGLVDAVSLHGGLAATALRSGGSETEARHILAGAGHLDVGTVLGDGVAAERRQLRISMAIGAVEGAVRGLSAGAGSDDPTAALRDARDAIVELVMRLLTEPD